MKMKAAVCNEHGKPMDIEEIDVVDPRPGDILVKVDATAVCQSDIHAIDGDVMGRLPGIAGHETVGHVEAVGEGVTRFKVGDYVCATTTTVGCGFCDECLAGRRANCTVWPMMAPMMREPGLFNSKGQPVGTLAGTVGGFAEYVLGTESMLVKIDESMPADKACMVSCAVISGFGSAQTAGVKPFSSAAIIGTGSVGINAIQGSYFLGACPVIAIDMLDSRLEAARKFGATHTINAGQTEDLVQAVKDLTGGKGADYVFITATTASNALNKQALEISSPTGTVCKVSLGGMTPESMKDIEWMRSMQGFGVSRKFISPMMGGSNVIQDIPNYIKLYQAGRLELDSLVSGHYPLEQINDAVAKLRTGEALRSIIMM
ncbi:MAG: alcohol dehydrogenase catalytic domain-containing protein [Dehalococcoidales bacterium]|nr:alcohol dehydrogenase catalytic domain-containing protein [Dehalococcoidales bacterium]